jgi:hypothetical protein
MPVASVTVSEGPRDTGNSQARGNRRIFVNVAVVVVVNELVPERLAEDQPGDCEKKNAYRADDPAGLRKSKG